MKPNHKMKELLEIRRIISRWMIMDLSLLKNMKARDIHTWLQRKPTLWTKWMLSNMSRGSNSIGFCRWWGWSREVTPDRMEAAWARTSRCRVMDRTRDMRRWRATSKDSLLTSTVKWRQLENYTATKTDRILKNPTKLRSFRRTWHHPT